MNHVTAADETKLCVNLVGFFRSFFGVDTARDPVSEEFQAWARSVSTQANLEATLECLKSFSSTDFRSDLAAFEVSSLNMHGSEDRTVPIEASSRAAAKRIKHSTVVECDGARHGLFVAHERRVTRDLIDFLGR